MSENEERDYIRTSLDEIEKQSGVRPLGWHGPEYGESERTPEILAGLGVRYVLDWPNDEQPYLMTTEAGSIVSIPMALELDDVIAHYHRRISMKRWKQGVIDAIDQLSSDGCQNGRHLVLNLHPWLTGHPHRIGFLEELLAEVRERKDVWTTTTGQIADHFLSYCRKN
jgi:peptidoglycan/xylan/chitin deacetylase (PgdA/CDA1 family)